jgi:molybdate transport system substrate-binding protein
MNSFARITALVFLLSAGRLAADEIVVFAAASLTDALTEIGAAHEKATGDKVRFNFAASSTLARQIEAGAPADVFFSADDTQMDGLEKKGLVDQKTRKAVLGNTLVVVTAPDGPPIKHLADLAKPAIRHLSMGNPKAVPAGVYAKAHLRKIGLWERLESRIAPAENARAALAVVASGNAEAGIVYKTDAAVSKKVRIALEIPASEGPEIRYPVALVSDSRHTTAARRFLDHLSDTGAGAVFVKHGFIILTKNE